MASVLTARDTRLYLYGITTADAGHAPRAGIGGAEVAAVVEQGVAAIVSRVGDAKIRPERAHLAAHHGVLREWAARGPVLPVVFGTLSRSETELRRVLRLNHGGLRQKLERLRGNVEMGLKVRWDLPNVFEYFVATHQELEAMRNRLFRAGRTPNVEEKMALGEAFVALLQQARQRHTARVKEARAPFSLEVREIDPGEERMIMKLACLVDGRQQALWEEGVREAASLFDDHYRFDYSGPWPPYNFARVDLEFSGEDQ